MCLIRLVAIFLLIYLIFRFLVMYIFPVFVRWYVKRVKRRFYQHHPHADPSKQKKKKAQTRFWGNVHQTETKTGSQIGEYVDYEEIKEDKKDKTQKDKNEK